MTFYRFRGINGDFVTHKGLEPFETLEDAMTQDPTDKRVWSVGVIFEFNGIVTSNQLIDPVTMFRAKYTTRTGWVLRGDPRYYSIKI